MPGELYRDVLIIFFSLLLQPFRRTLQLCFAVKLQKSFVDYENSAGMNSRSRVNLSFKVEATLHVIMRHQRCETEGV